MSDSEDMGDAGAGNEGDGADLSPLHQLFLQAVISRRSVAEKTAQKIHKKCCTILKGAWRLRVWPQR